MASAASEGVGQQRSDSSWLAGGARPEVVTVGDPRLRAPVEPIADVAQVADRVDAMVDLLREMRGAGLAAPQVGWSAAAAVVEVRKTEAFPDRPESPLYVLLNPEVVELSGESVEDWEGCFSVPGLIGRVTRADSITVRFTDRDGQALTERFEGYVARVVQHELDHLDVGALRLHPRPSQVHLRDVLDAGFNISAVTERQGHTPPVLATHYTKSRRSADRKAAEHLGRLVHCSQAIGQKSDELPSL